MVYICNALRQHKPVAVGQTKKRNKINILKHMVVISELTTSCGKMNGMGAKRRPDYLLIYAGLLCVWVMLSDYTTDVFLKAEAGALQRQHLNTQK